MPPVRHFLSPMVADDCVSKQRRLQRAHFQSPFSAAVTELISQRQCIYILERN